MDAARVSKVVELIGSVQKAAKVYAGHRSGRFPPEADFSLLTTLNSRHLIPIAEGNSSYLTGFTFVRGEHGMGGTRHFALVITCTSNPLHCADIWHSKNGDSSLVGGTVGSVTCDGPPPVGTPPAGGTVHLCFRIF